MADSNGNKKPTPKKKYKPPSKESIADLETKPILATKVSDKVFDPYVAYEKMADDEEEEETETESEADDEEEEESESESDSESEAESEDNTDAKEEQEIAEQVDQDVESPAKEPECRNMWILILIYQ